MSSYSSMTSTTDQGGGTAITAVPPEIIQTHILPRLDGPTLASTGCASPELHALCAEEKFWKDVCNSTWPSINDPRVRDTISAFPSGHRSFFSDSYPILDHQFQLNPHRPSTTTELISCVDIHYQNKVVYSKAKVMETVSDWFQSSSFWVDLLDPNETVAIPVKFDNGEETSLSCLEQYMTLSWIFIDPNGKRAANVSSLRPVSVKRNWLTGEGDVRVRYSSIMAGGRRDGQLESVQCRIMVTCVGKEGGGLHVTEVSFQMLDMDGKSLSGKESMVILLDAIESRGRKKGRTGEEKERYEVYSKMRRERRERKKMRERRLNMESKATRFIFFCDFNLVAFWVLYNE